MTMNSWQDFAHRYVFDFDALAHKTVALIFCQLEHEHDGDTCIPINIELGTE